MRDPPGDTSSMNCLTANDDSPGDAKWDASFGCFGFL